MCTNTKFIRNKYSHEKVLVKCGHCPACKQEKANRLTSRINFEAADGLKHGQIQVFLTLTYDMYSVPYVRISDLLEYFHQDHFYDMPVYRDSERVRTFGSVNTIRHIDHLGNVTLPPMRASFTFNQLNKYHLHQNKGYGKIGIIYYKDLQAFEKRLLSNIRRSENPYKVKFFNTAEYGETYSRPHFHVVCQIPKDRLAEFRDSVVRSWTYHDWTSPESRRRFEVARNVGSYVASYVNKPDDVPAFLEHLFPSKHSFSLFFGYSSDKFTYPSIKEMVERRDLHLPIMFDQLRGEDSLRLVPQHVICRYFPKFKGLCRLSVLEVHDVLRFPQNLSKYAERLEYSGNDLTDNIRIILRSRNRCGCRVDGERYAREYLETWSVWKLSLLRDFYLSQQSGQLPLNQSYDNAVQYLRTPSRLRAYGLSDNDLLLPNEMPIRKVKTKYLTEKYLRKKKQKKVSSVYYSDGTSNSLFY